MSGAIIPAPYPDFDDTALCRQVDAEAFFPEKGGSTREAKAVCRRCEWQRPCLAYALTHDERFGVWGGVSERERRKLQQQFGIKPIPAYEFRAAQPSRPSDDDDFDQETA